MDGQQAMPAQSATIAVQLETVLFFLNLGISLATDELYGTDLIFLI